MKLLLLSIGLGLAGALQDLSQVPVQPGFRPEQVEGPWHTISLGATDRSVIEEGSAYFCFMTGIRRLENGNLNVTYFSRNDGKCVEEFYIGEQTDIPGRYTFEYQGKNYLTFVVVSDQVAIMDLEKPSDEGSLIVVELHERTLSVGEAGLAAYQEHLSRRGIGQDNVVDLAAYRRCPSPGP